MTLNSWADARETDPSVAELIHALSTGGRSPDTIWADPTPDEWRRIAQALPDGRYSWGSGFIVGVSGL